MGDVLISPRLASIFVLLYLDCYDFGPRNIPYCCHDDDSLRLLLLEVRRSLMPKVTCNLPPASIILHAEGS